MAEHGGDPQISVGCALEILLAGAPALQLQFALAQLPSRRQRQAVLCTACGIRDEVGESCRERADEMGEFLAANCELYDLSRRPCMLLRVYGMNLAELP